MVWELSFREVYKVKTIFIIILRLFAFVTLYHGYKVFHKLHDMGWHYWSDKLCTSICLIFWSFRVLIWNGKYWYIAYINNWDPNNLFKHHLKVCLLIYRERFERKRETDWLPPMHAPNGDYTCNLGTSPEWEANLQPFGCMGWCSNQLSHLASTGASIIFTSVKMSWDQNIWGPLL